MFTYIMLRQLTVWKLKVDFITVIIYIELRIIQSLCAISFNIPSKLGVILFRDRQIAIRWPKMMCNFEAIWPERHPGIELEGRNSKSREMRAKHRNKPCKFRRI